jgi:hypothetical protein
MVDSRICYSFISVSFLFDNIPGCFDFIIFYAVLLPVLQELVWESVAIMNRQVYTEIPVVFEDVRFHRATNIPKEGT